MKRLITHHHTNMKSAILVRVMVRVKNRKHLLNLLTVCEIGDADIRSIHSVYLTHVTRKHNTTHTSLTYTLASHNYLLYFTHMQKKHHDPNLELLNKKLCDPVVLAEYKATYDHYKPSIIPRVLGGFLVLCGNIVYGRNPSYLKFRAVEVIARVPYHSWSSASYTHLTLHFTDEKRALHYSQSTRFSDIAQANETMHVVVISHILNGICKAGFIRHTLIPVLFSFFYFWSSYLLYMLNTRWSYELNYLFESHAFAQYSTFIEKNAEMLKATPMESTFLEHYGRPAQNQYDFFVGVRNDEIIHRNMSIEAIGKM